MSAPVDALFFFNLATVLNKYLGLCLILLERKGATISKVLEKRESIVSVTSSFSELLDMLRN